MTEASPFKISEPDNYELSAVEIDPISPMPSQSEKPPAVPPPLSYVELVPASEETKSTIEDLPESQLDRRREVLGNKPSKTTNKGLIPLGELIAQHAEPLNQQIHKAKLAREDPDTSPKSGFTPKRTSYQKPLMAGFTVGLLIATVFIAFFM